MENNLSKNVTELMSDFYAFDELSSSQLQGRGQVTRAVLCFCVTLEWLKTMAIDRKVSRIAILVKAKTMVLVHFAVAAFLPIPCCATCFSSHISFHS